MSQQTPAQKRPEKGSWRKKMPHWRRVETRYFLEQCLKRNVLGVVSEDDVLEQLSADMREAGFVKTAQQCRKKLKQLEAGYKRLARGMLFFHQMELLFRKHAQTDQSTSVAHADPGCSSSFVPAVQIETQSVDSDSGDPSGSSSIMKSDLSEEIKNINTENTLDNSVVEKVNINQTKDVLTNDVQPNNILFKQSMFERLNKIENNLNRTKKLLQEMLSFQKEEHSRLGSLLECQISFLEDFARMNNFNQSNAET